MKISTLMISVFLIGLFSAGFITFYSSLLGANAMSTSNFTSTNNTSTTMNYLNEIYSKTEQGQNTTVPTSLLSDSAPTNIWAAAFNAVMYSFKMPDFFVGLIGDFTSEVTGVPDYVGGFLVAIVMVIVIASLIYLIIGRVF